MASWSDSVHDQSAVDRKAFGWDSVGDGGGQQQIADDFRTGLTGTVTKLSWTGKYHDSSIPAAKTFEIRIFADSHVFSQSLPVTGIDSGTTDIGPHRLLTYTVWLNGCPALKGDRRYWLSIRENDPSTTAVWSWSFHNGDVAGGYSYRRADGATWAVGARDMAYSLFVAPAQ